MKKVTKKTTKVTKPKYTIDMRNFDDVTADFIGWKVKNRMPLTNSDIDTAASILLDSLLKELLPENGTAIVRQDGVYTNGVVFNVEMKAKKPWYKRLWNWITRKK